MAHLWGSKPMSPKEAETEALFHSKLVQQANSMCEPLVVTHMAGR